MKMKKSIITGVVAALALSMTAHAEDENQRGKKAKGDKKQTAEQREAMQKKMLARFDTNKDGELSADEKKAGREAMLAERKEIRAAVLKQFDANKDGKLGADEREGVREWVKANYPNAINMGPRRGGKDKGGKKEGGQGRRGGNA